MESIAPMKTYHLSMHVDGTAEMDVRANSLDEAIEIASNQICEAEYDLNNLVDVYAEFEDSDDYDEEDETDAEKL